MGITELSASLAPRRKMNSNFFPFNPMLPSAKARFMTNGISTSVDNATPRPSLKERSRKPRRVRILNCCILLLLETLEGHQRANHTTNTRVVGRGIARHGLSTQRRRIAAVVRVQKVDGQSPVEIQIRLAFARIKYAKYIIGHVSSIGQRAGRIQRRQF